MTLFPGATGAILCGGRSCRMGFDKAFIKNRDEWLLAANAKSFSTWFDTSLLVSDNAQKLVSLSEIDGQQVVEDSYSGCGPLGGIYTALAKSPLPYTFVAACDMPILDRDLIAGLYNHLADHQVVLYRTKKRLHTLFAFYHRSCLPVFKAQLDRGDLQIRRDFDRLRVMEIELAEDTAEKAFRNLNTPEELAAWLGESYHTEEGSNIDPTKE